MSATQTLHLIEKLTEANIPKETATELLEYVEQKQTDLVTKDYFEARITSVEDKLTAAKDELNVKITAVEDKLTATKDELNAKFTGLKLFMGFNTALLLAVIGKLFLG